MAKIAWTVGQVFTRARKTAPAEFREIENQLYSLSAALAALKDAHSAGTIGIIADSNTLSSDSISSGQSAGSQDTVDNILSNCRETLKHLENIVNKYGVITEQIDSDKSRLKRWSESFVKGYRRIAWTMEDGDLQTLRSQLMVHTNSLELVLGVAIK